MLTPDFLNHVSDDIIELYSKLDESIIRDIVRRLIKSGRVTDTAAWQIDRLQDGGLFKAAIIAEISKCSDAAQSSVKALFEECGITSMDYDRGIFEKSGIPVPPIQMSPMALELLKAGMQKTSSQLKNLTMTTASTAQQAYINAATLAEMQVERGMLDYQTAIRKAIIEASKDGTTISFPSGHIDKLDVAVRRAVLTGVNQTMGEISLQNAKEFGCDIMELTAHGGARPNHAEWQGKLVSLSGKKGYLTLQSISYGSGSGFMGWNCRHNWNPFFLGISTPNYTKEQLDKLEEKSVEYNGKKYTDYEISQLERQRERSIRENKRVLAGLDEGIKNSKDESLKAGLHSSFDKYAVNLKQQEAQLKDLLAQTKRLPDGARVQVLGFGHSQAGKAVWAVKRQPEKVLFDIKYTTTFEKAKLPNYQHASIPTQKLEGYALNKDHLTGKNKAIAFEKYLGYTVDNQEELIREIRKGLKRYKSTPRPETQYGQPFEVLMMIKGTKGQYAKVKTGWLIDKASDTPRLTTIYVDE